MDLLERTEFFQQLQDTFAGVTQGHGRVVLVCGEAGIGKTSLVEQFTSAQAQENRVLWGGCDALFTPRPLGPLYDIAQQLRGNLITLLQDEAPRSAIFTALFDELRNSTSTVVVIEDVHWADEATLDLLKFLGRRINWINSMLVVTYRDDELGADHPFRNVLGDLPHRSVARLRLPPLSPDAVRHLAERAGRGVEDLYEVTGGNPFFVTEALESKAPGVPVTVRDAVLARAARLSPAARAVVELVSVVPARTETWLLDETIGSDTAALEECIGAGVLRCDGEAIAFRHELARRAVEDAIPVTRRQSLHNVVLQALLKRGPNTLLPRIVHHAALAGDAAAVLKYAPAAAAQAAALKAHRESAAHYQTALRYADLLPAEERAALFERRSFECHITDQNEESLRARREALEIWKTAGNRLREGDNLRWMSRVYWCLGHRVEAEHYAAESVTALENLPPGPELATAYSNRSQLHMLTDDYEQAVVWGSRAIELAEKLGATETLVHALNNVGCAELLVRNAEGRSKLEESLRLALANNLQDHAARAFSNLASFAVQERNYALAMRYLADGLAYTTEYDLDFGKLYKKALRARAFFEQGEWDRAADDASFVLEHHKVSTISKIPALAVLGHLRVRRGDPDAAPLLDEAHQLALETGELQRLAPVAAARAEFAWLQGDLDSVMREARVVVEMAKGHDESRLRGEFPVAFWVWRAGGAIEGHEELDPPYSLQVAGDWRAAAAMWKEIGCPYEQAMALADGDDEARLAALEIFERLGARPAAERLRHTLRELGARGIPRGPRPSTKENPAGLTARQMEVLSLMSEGSTNAEIAERLFISTKTVDHHVSAILAKLEAHTRSEAVSLALQSHLIKPK